MSVTTTKPGRKSDDKKTAIRRFTASQNFASARRWAFMPLDVLLSAMHEGLAEQRHPSPAKGLGTEFLPDGRFTQQQLDAAALAAPYVHPKLAAVAYKEAPDDNRERRRNMLAAIPFAQRQEILRILAAAQAQAEDTVGDVVESVATDAEESGK